VATAAVCVAAFLLLPRGGPAHDAQLRKLQVRIPGIEVATFPEMNAEKSALYFSGQDTSGATGIFRQDLETADLDLLVPYGTQPTLSPDGTQLAYLSRGEDGSLLEPYVMALPNGRPRLLPDSIDAFFWLDNHTVGGRASSGERFGRTAIAYDLESQQKRTIVDIREDVRGGGLYFTGSRLGNDLILYDHEFVDGSSPILYLYNSRSESSSVLFEGGMNGYFLGPNHVVYQTADGAELLLQSIDLKASTTLGRPSEIAPQLDWSRFKTTRDGELLFFDQPPTESWLKVFDNAGNVVQAHQMPPFSAGWRANRAGTTLVGLGRASTSTINAGVALFDVASGAVSTIREPLPGVGLVQWSFDERRVRVLESQDARSFRSYSVPANGVGRETPLENEVGIEYSFDGSRSIFARISAGADSIEVIARNEASGQERLIYSRTITGEASGASISPDGNYIQVRRGDDSWVTPFEGAGEAPIPVELDTWGPSGQYLYGSQDGKIIRAPYSTDGGFHMTGPLEIVLDVDDTDATLVSVQPDRIITINEEYVDNYVVLHWWQNYAASLGE